MIAQAQDEPNLSPNEYKLLSPEQSETYQNLIPQKQKTLFLAMTGKLDDFKYAMQQEMMNDFDKAERDATKLLNHAARTNNIPLIELLMDNLAFDEHKYTQYMVANAADKGSLDTIKYLVDRGIDVGTAPVNASRYGRKDVLQYLLPYISNDSKNNQVFDEIMANIIGGNQLDILKMFVEHFKLSQKDFYQAWLDHVADNKYYDMLEYLVELINGVPDYVLKRVVGDNELKVTEFLLSYGANPQKAIPIAIRKGNKDMINLLTKHGAKITQKLIDKMNTKKPIPPDMLQFLKP